MQSVFPELEFVELKGYRIKYGSTGFLTLLKLIFQIPKILTAINRENKWLKRITNEKHVDIIVSDNRFGLHNHGLISIFITHQLHIKTSLGKLADIIAQKINYHFINQFDVCWVPDAAGNKNLAGALSHPAILPAIPLHYTGILSAIKKQTIQVTNKLLVLLSGPEPQRSILENILLQQLKNYTQPVVVVRGLPAAGNALLSTGAITFYNYCSGDQLQQLINASDIIISRSGYSTLMDLLPLGKKCIVIPTPGQAEQEYLATWLADQNFVCTCTQDNFSLPVLLGKAAGLQVPDLSWLNNDTAVDEAFAALATLLASGSDR